MGLFDKAIENFMQHMFMGVDCDKNKLVKPSDLPEGASEEYETTLFNLQPQILQQDEDLPPGNEDENTGTGIKLPGNGAHLPEKCKKYIVAYFGQIPQGNEPIYISFVNTGHAIHEKYKRDEYNHLHSDIKNEITLMSIIKVHCILIDNSLATDFGAATDFADKLYLAIEDIEENYKTMLAIGATFALTYDSNTDPINDEYYIHLANQTSCSRDINLIARIVRCAIPTAINNNTPGIHGVIESIRRIINEQKIVDCSDYTIPEPITTPPIITQVDPIIPIITDHDGNLIITNEPIKILDDPIETDVVIDQPFGPDNPLWYGVGCPIDGPVTIENKENEISDNPITTTINKDGTVTILDETDITNPKITTIGNDPNDPNSITDPDTGVTTTTFVDNIPVNTNIVNTDPNNRNNQIITDITTDPNTDITTTTITTTEPSTTTTITTDPNNNTKTTTTTRTNPDGTTETVTVTTDLNTGDKTTIRETTKGTKTTTCTKIEYSTGITTTTCETEDTSTGDQQTVTVEDDPIDGTTTTTIENPDGTTTTTIENPDGTTTTTIENPDGTTTSNEPTPLGGGVDLDDISGCTNSRDQVNYNEAANVDDGSCQISGCMDKTNFFYDSEATVDGVCDVDKTRTNFCNLEVMANNYYQSVMDANDITEGEKEMLLKVVENYVRYKQFTDNPFAVQEFYNYILEKNNNIENDNIFNKLNPVVSKMKHKYNKIFRNDNHIFYYDVILNRIDRENYDNFGSVNTNTQDLIINLNTIGKPNYIHFVEDMQFFYDNITNTYKNYIIVEYKVKNRHVDDNCEVTDSNNNIIPGGFHYNLYFMSETGLELCVDNTGQELKIARINDKFKINYFPNVNTNVPYGEVCIMNRDGDYYKTIFGSDNIFESVSTQYEYNNYYTFLKKTGDEYSIITKDVDSNISYFYNQLTHNDILKNRHIYDEPTVTILDTKILELKHDLKQISKKLDSVSSFNIGQILEEKKRLLISFSSLDNYHKFLAIYFDNLENSETLTTTTEVVKGKYVEYYDLLSLKNAYHSGRDVYDTLEYELIKIDNTNINSQLYIVDDEEINRQPISVFINDTQTANFKCEKVVRTQEPFSEFSQLFYHITTTVSAVTNHYICTNKPMAGPKVDGNSTKAKIYDLKCKIFGYSPSLFENNIDQTNFVNLKNKSIGTDSNNQFNNLEFSTSEFDSIIQLEATNDQVMFLADLYGVRCINMWDAKYNIFKTYFFSPYEVNLGGFEYKEQDKLQQLSLNKTQRMITNTIPNIINKYIGMEDEGLLPKDRTYVKIGNTSDSLISSDNIQRSTIYETQADLDGRKVIMDIINDDSVSNDQKNELVLKNPDVFEKFVTGGDNIPDCYAMTYIIKN